MSGKAQKSRLCWTRIDKSQERDGERMKQQQTRTFWEELDGTTEISGAIDKYKNKSGYGGKRTLERYAQAHKGFREGESIPELAVSTGWSLGYLEKMHIWWQDAYGRRGEMLISADTVASNTAGKLQDWVRDNFTEFSRIVAAAKEDLRYRIEVVEVSRGQRATIMPRKFPFGPTEEAVTKEVLRSDPHLSELRKRFDEAITEANTQKARRLIPEIAAGLDGWCRFRD